MYTVINRMTNAHQVKNTIPHLQGGFFKGPCKQEVSPPEKTFHLEWGWKPGQGCAFPVQWVGEDET